MIRRTSLAFAALVPFALWACSTSTSADPTNESDDTTSTDDVGTDDTAKDAGSSTTTERLAPEIGTGDKSASSVTLTEIATAKDGLKQPRDLAFNTRNTTQLWVVNNGDNGTLIMDKATTEDRSSEYRIDGYAIHFMANPAAIDFGQDDTTFGVLGTFGTCGESRNTYGGQTPGNDFMGPVLWSSDLSVFAAQDPEGLGSHLDMLHNTPLCMGIDHETANRYWVFEGLSGSIALYDFKLDHNIGQDDHTDGEYYQYAKGQVAYVEGVPSHVVYNPADKMLYIADSGNSRIAKLDTTTGTKGATIKPKEPMPVSVAMDGTQVDDVVAAKTKKLTTPSGIELYNDLLYVSDNATGRITAFTLKGKEVNHLDTDLPAGALAGMAFGPDKKLYVVDMVGNRVLRIDPKKTK